MDLITYAICATLIFLVGVITYVVLRNVVYLTGKIMFMLAKPAIIIISIGIAIMFAMLCVLYVPRIERVMNNYSVFGIPRQEKEYFKFLNNAVYEAVTNKTMLLNAAVYGISTAKTIIAKASEIATGVSCIAIEVAAKRINEPVPDLCKTNSLRDTFIYGYFSDLKFV